MENIKIILITSRENKTICEVMFKPLKDVDFKNKEIMTWSNKLNNESGLSLISTYENMNTDIKKLLRKVEKEALDKIREATLILNKTSKYRIKN